ncbi:MAG TPA: hypothetical protein VL463_34585 [Kofleriaceae bacterium]|jgi:hypothetical protein|nr:hypothetical protein [Kofleriaceae bacterium]
MRIACALVFVVACGGGGVKPPPPPMGSAGDSCAGVDASARALYEAEAKATDQLSKNPSFVDDNVAMVVKDCAKDPARVAVCTKAAKSVAQLESDCLVPLDEEGTEGETTP